MSAWRGLGDGSDTPLSRSSQVSHSSGKVQRGTNRGPSHSDVPNLLGQRRGTSPENVRERVLRPRGYSWPVSKIGDARSCISQPRNVEKLFTYYSDHLYPEQEQLDRQKSRENLYRSHTPPPVPHRVRSASVGHARAGESASQHSCNGSLRGSLRDGSFSDRSSSVSGRLSSRTPMSARSDSSTSPSKARGASKWAVPGHGHMALWGNVTQPHVSPKASWPRHNSSSWHNGSTLSLLSDKMSESGSVAFSPAASVRSFSTMGRNPSVYDYSEKAGREKDKSSHNHTDTANISATMRRSLQKAAFSGDARRASSPLCSSSSGLRSPSRTTSFDASPRKSVRASCAQTPPRDSKAQDTYSVAGSLCKSTFSALSVTSSIASTTRKMDADMIKSIKSRNHHSGAPLPNDLYGEFFFVKDTLDSDGGVQVGFGGLGMLRQLVLRGRVDGSTVLVVEVEFCTHGYDGVGRGNPTENAYYKHYMDSCDLIESLLYPKWNLCFVIKPGKPRFSSFEVRLLWLVGSVEYCTSLHSKLCSKKLPDPTKLARRIDCALEGPGDEDEFYDEVGALPSDLLDRRETSEVRSKHQYSPTPWLQQWTRSLSSGHAGHPSGLPQDCADGSGDHNDANELGPN